MACQIVTINVGGTHFSTSCDTLQREPSSKLALLTRGILPSPSDDGGHIFIDRDDRYFQAILNYLRDGWALLPPTASERRELLQEARFFQLTGMESWLRTQELLGDKSDAIPIGAASPSATPDASPIMEPTTPTKSPPRRVRSYSTPTPIYTPYTPPRVTNPLTSPRTPSPAPRPFAGSTCALRCCSACCKTSCKPCSACCKPCCSCTCCSMRQPICSPCCPPVCVPAPAADGFRWTSKYLRTNPKIREVVDTLLELSFMPPHNAIATGKVYVSIVCCPEGETYLSNKYLVVKVSGAFGWTFEFTVRPTCDYCLYQKYALTEYVQDNWFVLSAILKDQYGICMEETACPRHSSILSRRTNMHIALSKPACCC